MDRLKSVVCKAEVNLQQNWSPLVLYCGFLVRQCNWSGQHPGSSIDTDYVLRLVFMLLKDLGRATADPLLYVRTIGVALMHWQAFNSALPRSCYGEVFGEFMLRQRLMVSSLSSDMETEIGQRLHS